MWLINEKDLVFPLFEASRHLICIFYTNHHDFTVFLFIKFKIEQRFDEIWPAWQMDKQLKETTTRKKNLLCWFDKNLQNGQNDDGKKTFFKSNHSMLVEAWKKLFAINDWWSLLDDLISPIIHQASATFHNCIHVQFIGQSHDNMSTRRKFFIKRGVVDLKFWIHSWDRKCKPKWQKPFVSCL